MSKITAEHLQRIACVYIRQSTADQLVHNLESQRRQYGLADRARQLGWTTVEIIDDDLGRSGGGVARPGFERLLAAICDRRVVRDEGIELPAKSRRGEAHGVVWRLPPYNIVHCILTNPIYAGAYAFGRTTSRISVVDGRKRVRRGVHRPIGEWDVLIKDHHAAYISWEAFERNVKAIANNATGMSSARARGAAREGELLLSGLLRCGHCGRKLHVHYGGKLGRYNCYGARMNHGAERCISVSGLSLDAAVAGEVLRVLRPLGVEAAVKAIEVQSGETTAAEQELELSLQQARYEAAHARRQYDAVDPANRLVAGELERRWNEALQAVVRIEGDIAAMISRRPPPLGEAERQHLLSLGADLERAWSHPASTPATRKRILRTAISEIVVRRDGAILHAVLHWQGGDHTELHVKQRLNAAGRHNPRIPDDTIALMRELARLMPDRQIARLLNRVGVATGYGNAWTQERVRGFRYHHEIACYRDGEWAERGEISLEEAAKIIGVCNMTALRMLRRGEIKGRQVCPGAPWVIRTADLIGFTDRKRSKRPLTPNPHQRAFDFQCVD